jgi:hypothetical protein
MLSGVSPLIKNHRESDETTPPGRKKPENGMMIRCAALWDLLIISMEYNP